MKEGGEEVGKKKEGGEEEGEKKEGDKGGVGGRVVASRVVAVGDVVCWSVDRKRFEAAVGSLAEAEAVDQR